MGGRPGGFHQPGFNQGFKGFQSGFNGFQPGFNAGGYNRSFPGLDSFGPFPFGGFKGRGLGSFAPWGGAGSWAGTPWWGYGGTTVYYPATYDTPGYYATPSAPVYVAPTPYMPPMSSSIAVTPAPAPPPPSVVSFPSGRYELRGDGFTSPFQWVWIPNALAVPPVPPAPPTAPPPAVTAAPEPSSANPGERRSQLYRWTDEQGVVHWTNRAEAVPAKYRAQAKFGPSS